MEIKTDLNIYLQPGAKKDIIYHWMDDGSLKVKIREKPIDGKANIYLIKYLSKIMKIKRNKMEIIRGERSRKKCIRFYGIDVVSLKNKINKVIYQDP